MNSSLNLQEIKTKVVSSIHLQNELFSDDETQAGVDTTHSNPLSTPPACKLAPGHNKEIGVLGRSEKLRGASNHNQGAEIDLSVVDGKHNRTGRRQGRSLGNSRLIVGSNPTHPICPIAQRLELHNQIRGTIVADGSSILSQGIPNGLNLQLFRSDPGAGTIFKPLPPTHTPAPTIIIGGNLCGS